MSKTIDQLPAAATLTGAETLPLNQAGVTKNCAINDITALSTAALASASSSIQTQLNNKVDAGITSGPNSFYVSNNVNTPASLISQGSGGALHRVRAVAGGIIIDHRQTDPGLVVSIALIYSTLIIKNPSDAPVSSIAGGAMGEIRFDTNYIYRCVADNTWKRTPLSQSLVTNTSAALAITDDMCGVIANFAGTTTLTLPSASAFADRILTIKTITANAVVSALSDVTPLAGGTPGTAILPATAGKFVQLQSDGTTWQIMMAN